MLAEACGSTAWVVDAHQRLRTGSPASTPSRRSRTSGARPATRASCGVLAPTSATAPRRRRPARVTGQLGLRLGLAALRVGGARRPRRQRGGRADRPGPCADPDERPDDRGHLVRRRDEGHRLATRWSPRTCSSRPPDHVGARRRSPTSTRPSTTTRRCTARRSSRSRRWCSPARRSAWPAPRSTSYREGAQAPDRLHDLRRQTDSTDVPARRSPTRRC